MSNVWVPGYLLVLQALCSDIDNLSQYRAHSSPTYTLFENLCNVQISNEHEIANIYLQDDLIPHSFDFPLGLACAVPYADIERHVRLYDDDEVLAPDSVPPVTSSDAPGDSQQCRSSPTSGQSKWDRKAWDWISRLRGKRMFGVLSYEFPGALASCRHFDSMQSLSDLMSVTFFEVRLQPCTFCAHCLHLRLT